MRKALAILTLISSALASCASFTPSEIVKPSEISLDGAIQDVSKSLHHAQDQYSSDKRLGLMVDEVQVQFQVAAAASNSGGAQLNVAAIPVSAAGGTIGGSIQGQEGSNANRGNTITVTFKNIASADMTKGYYTLFRPQAQKKKPAKNNTNSGGSNEQTNTGIPTMTFQCPPGTLCTMSNSKPTPANLTPGNSQNSGNNNGERSSSDGNGGVHFTCPRGTLCTMQNSSDR
jgi:hypothetical protein